MSTHSAEDGEELQGLPQGPWRLSCTPRRNSSAGFTVCNGRPLSLVVVGLSPIDTSLPVLAPRAAPTVEESQSRATHPSRGVS